MSDKIREALAGMLAIVDESRGVEGYHFDGDIAAWDEFPEVEAARAALAQQPAPVNKSVIRDVFLRNGFTIKEGQTDLKPYVYAAAEELLSLDGKAVAAAPAAPVAQEPVAWIPLATLEHLRRRIRQVNVHMRIEKHVGCVPIYADPPAAEQPEQRAYACPRCGASIATPEPYSVQVSCRACGKSSAATAAQVAAEQPDTVAVPRELLAELRAFTLEHDSGRAGVLRGQIDALLGKEGEA